MIPLFGERLKELRTEKSMLQKELAALLKVSPSTIGMYERGKRDPDTETLKFLSDYFYVSIYYLLGRTDERKPCSSTKLTKKDKKEIDEYMEGLEHELEGLMFDGMPISEEDKQLLLEQIERTTELIKLRNKEKYTPKKYTKK